MTRAGTGREVVLAIVGFALAVAVFWGSIVPLFRPDLVNLLTLDVPQYFYPKFWYGAEELKARRLPLWNPYEYCGMPFFGTAQPAALYPVKTVLFWVLRPEIAFHANYVVHLLVAACAEYAYVRWLGVGVPAAAAAGMLWAFNLEFAGGLPNPNRVMVLSWVPLIFLAVSWALERRTRRAAALAGAAIAWQVYAGYPGFTLCLGVFLAILVGGYLWAARTTPRTMLALLGCGAAIAAFALAFAAPQLFTMAEALQHSNREGLVSEWTAGYERTTTHWTDWKLVVTTFLQDLSFVAGPAAGFALVGVLRDRRLARHVAFVSVPVLHLAGTLLVPYLRQLPGFGAFRAPWVLWNMYVPFFMATFAALGVDWVVRTDPDDRRARQWTALYPLLTAVVITINHVVRGGMMLWMPWVAVVAGSVAIGVGGRRRGLAVSGFLCAAVLGAALVLYDRERGIPAYPSEVPNPALYTVIREDVSGGRIFAPMLRRAGQQMLSRLPEAGGYETSLLPFRVGRLMRLAGLSDEVTLIGGLPDWDAVLRYRPVIDVLAIRAIAVPDVLGIEAKKPNVVAAGFVEGRRLPYALTVLHNPRGRPRAYTVHEARGVASADDAFAAVTRPTFQPADEAIIEGDAPRLAAARTPDRVTIAIDQPSRVAVDVETDARALLVLVDGNYPGWRATVDGVATSILPTNYAFRGVVVEAGAHRVEFTYRPMSFWMGAFMALGAAVVGFAGRRTVPPA